MKKLKPTPLYCRMQIGFEKKEKRVMIVPGKSWTVYQIQLVGIMILM
jgi:hypothetical protein